MQNDAKASYYEIKPPPPRSKIEINRNRSFFPSRKIDPELFRIIINALCGEFEGVSLGGRIVIVVVVVVVLLLLLKQRAVKFIYHVLRASIIYLVYGGIHSPVQRNGNCKLALAGGACTRGLAFPN